MAGRSPSFLQRSKCVLQESLGDVEAGGSTRRGPRALQQVGLFAGIAGHGQRLRQERDRLVVSPEMRRAPGRGAQGDPRLAGKGIDLRTVDRVGMRRKVVAGKGAGQFVRTQGLEEAGGRKMPHLAVLPGQGAVGDLADHRLHESVLAAHAPPVGLECQ